MRMQPHPTVTAARERRRSDLAARVAASARTVAMDADSGFQVYLFGSWARGTFSGFSDVDLLVITDRDDADLATRIRAALAHVGDDVLLISRDAYQALAGRSHFWTEVDRDRVAVWSSRDG